MVAIAVLPPASSAIAMRGRVLFCTISASKGRLSGRSNSRSHGSVHSSFNIQNAVSAHDIANAAARIGRGRLKIFTMRLPFVRTGFQTTSNASVAK